ncbi:uncharacterized protein N7518_001031 [Penicillium psychrosexuale]|uniref:uncharacterized protein n=1 Tax=Penicillium psychrosexuale TaxID=1002107 RepID=UPI002545A6D2|nr:uncharacterized protein N7518_001031 [Penicillium psychrosexuale]KAJ5804728.1 hypothetical protein N7518_001031 [Penicillium psychrosexuale]
MKVMGSISLDRPQRQMSAAAITVPTYCYYPMGQSLPSSATLAIIGSSGWTDYEASADVVITSKSGVVGRASCFQYLD